MTGISAGFASVFGTPLAGTVFGVEVLAIGTVSYDAIAPCVVAAFVGDLVTRAWHIHHTVYTVAQVPRMSVVGVLCAMAAGCAFGLTGMMFARLTHAISRVAKRHIAWAPMRPFVGGIVVAVAVLFGTSGTKASLMGERV